MKRRASSRCPQKYARCDRGVGPHPPNAWDNWLRHSPGAGSGGCGLLQKNTRPPGLEPRNSFSMGRAFGAGAPHRKRVAGAAAIRRQRCAVAGSAARVTRRRRSAHVCVRWAAAAGRHPQGPVGAFDPVKTGCRRRQRPPCHPIEVNTLCDGTGECPAVSGGGSSRQSDSTTTGPRARGIGASRAETQERLPFYPKIPSLGRRAERAAARASELANVAAAGTDVGFESFPGNPLGAPASRDRCQRRAGIDLTPGSRYARRQDGGHGCMRHLVGSA